MEDIGGKKIEERKEKIRAWLKDKSNLIFLGIIIFSIIIRLYYFLMTKDQTVWHDEAEYLSMAKHFFFDVPYILNPQRIFLFPWITGLLFILGLSEQTIRFFLVIIPSIILVILVYLLGKEMFNKEIALIASLLTSVSWTLLFWTMRFQPDLISMCFQVLSILFMWKYWKNKKTSLIIYSSIFASLGFMFKVSGLLVPVIFFVFIFIKDKFSIFKNKDYWIFLAIFIIVLIPQLIYAHYAFGNSLALFGTTYTTSVVNDMPFGWYNLNFYYLFTENILFILFLIGVLISLSFLTYLDILIKDKNKLLSAELFSILIFVIISSYYIFWIKGTDDRWVFLWLPFIFFIIGKALLFIYGYLKKYNKLFALIIILTLLGYGVYSQMNHVDELIKIKKDSYSQVKDAAFWIKENSESGDLILSASYPQTVYYSERKVQYYRPTFENESSFNSFVNLNKPKFIVVSVFEYHDKWLLDWVDKNQYRLIIKKVYFADQEQKNALLIIYEINFSTSQPTS
ncbi:MAG: glycosyltransferase family 39 protein [Nanoarchaeota archaeon]